MRSYKTEGIIIRRRNFRDADRILTVLTANHGKIAVRASGIRKIPSRRSPHVELLNHCVLSLYNGHAFPILTEAQTIDSFAGVKEDLHKIGLAYHLCELVDGLCPEGQENRAVFNLVKSTLTRLSAFSHSDRSVSAVEESFQQSNSVKIDPSTEFTLSEVEGLGMTGLIHDFQTELLHLLGFWNKQEFLTKEIDMDHFVENILERKLKSKSIFTKLQ